MKKHIDSFLFIFTALALFVAVVTYLITKHIDQIDIFPKVNHYGFFAGTISLVIIAILLMKRATRFLITWYRAVKFIRRWKL